MSEVTPQSSPYGYTLGNPVRFSDPTGMLTEENGLITTSTSVLGRDVTGGENSGYALESKNFEDSPSHNIILNSKGDEISRNKSEGGNRYFVQYKTDDGNTEEIEVNSPETVKGDLKEQNLWNGNIVDLDEKKLRELVSSRTDPIIQETSGLKNPATGTNPSVYALKLLKAIVRESQEGGGIDYVDKFVDGTIYKINGVHYNSHEGLNYLWGASLNKLGIPKSVAVMGANFYHRQAYNRDVKLGRKDKYLRVGPKNEWNHNKAIKAGYGL
jgi:hypothetical protein